LPDRLSRGLLGLLSSLVHRIFHTLLLGDLVEGVFYRLIGGHKLLELRPGLLLGVGKLFKEFLELGAVVLNLTLERP
jgi:hypothetical protein